MHTLSGGVLGRYRRRCCILVCTGAPFAAAGPFVAAGVSLMSRRFHAGDAWRPPKGPAAASAGTSTDLHARESGSDSEPVTRLPSSGQPPAATADHSASAAAPPPTSSTPMPKDMASPVVPPTDGSSGPLTTPDPEPVRWVQPSYQDPATLPVVDAKGEYIVSRVQWPTGEVAYRTPAPLDDKLAPRFGYNVVQVRKHVSWWKYNQKYPRLSLAYINIQVLFLVGLAWLVAFLTNEYRQTTELMRTPGAMVGEHRGKGPATNRTQKITFEKDEMSALLDKAQNNWYDGKAEASYVGSKEYKMKKIPRPREFSVDDFRKR
ncbi:hypothetical protein JKF63_05516 [Porcisia hertigi]|uniref:Uncharacterized protein n=1 Tax=Porcisia hertigi TaxID=2761500 RepID=A0A836IMV9_9TRYP|nr:hypothetical protein JKF63_05516 [Porcisia hertigi]